MTFIRVYLNVLEIIYNRCYNSRNEKMYLMKVILLFKIIQVYMYRQFLILLHIKVDPNTNGETIGTFWNYRVIYIHLIKF